MRLTSKVKNSLSEYCGFLLLAVFLGSLIWLSHSRASNLGVEPRIEPAAILQNLKRQPRKIPPCPNCGPKGNQEIYIPLIDLPEAYGSQIVFNSRSPQAMNVTPIFYKRDGEMVTGDQVTVQAEEIRYVDIKQLMPERYRHERDWGGFSLTYDGFNREMWSQFRFLGVNGGSNVDEFFTVTAESHSDELEAAWWMPEKSEAIIALGNITDTATTATITLGDDRDRQVQLAPHATEILRYKSEKGERAESAVINVTPLVVLFRLDSLRPRTEALTA